MRTLGRTGVKVSRVALGAMSFGGDADEHVASQLNDEQNRLLKNQILGFAKMVAAAAGGFLGVGRVSKDEEKVLARIESAFHR